MKENLKSFLEKSEKARERKSKDKALVFFLLKDRGTLPQTPDSLTTFCHEFNTADRLWRQILQENESLRGKDYGHGQILSQEWQINNNYDVGYTADIQRKLL